MKVPKYQIVGDRAVAGNAGQSFTEGDIVYKLIGYDYGLAHEDSQLTGVPHTSVTLEEDGSYPSFTVPTHLLRPVD